MHHKLGDAIELRPLNRNSPINPLKTAVYKLKFISYLVLGFKVYSINGSSQVQAPYSAWIYYNFGLFDCLKHTDCELLRINHSLHHKHPGTGVHTSSIEGTWLAIKLVMRNNHNHKVGQYDSYLAEYMWRKSHNPGLEFRFSLGRESPYQHL